MPDQQRYARPPITEAVIEVRIKEVLGLRELERIRDRFKRDSPTIEEITTVQFNFQAGKISNIASPAGFKFTSKEAVNVVLVQPNSLATSRLAPYESWENLISKARSNFDIFTKIVGRRSVVRLGARFVNRFDIPNTMIVGRDISEFLKIGISLPEEIAKTIGPYSLVASTTERNTGAKLLIQSGIAAPALIDHTSITLDIDAFWDTEIAQRIDTMWEQTEILRTAKNSVFENSITDNLRELFR